MLTSIIYMSEILAAKVQKEKQYPPTFRMIFL